MFLFDLLNFYFLSYVLALFFSFTKFNLFIELLICILYCFSYFLQLFFCVPLRFIYPLKNYF